MLKHAHIYVQYIHLTFFYLDYIYTTHVDVQTLKCNSHAPVGHAVVWLRQRVLDDRTLEEPRGDDQPRHQREEPLWKRCERDRVVPVRECSLSHVNTIKICRSSILDVPYLHQISFYDGC